MQCVPMVFQCLDSVAIGSARMTALHFLHSRRGYKGSAGMRPERCRDADWRGGNAVPLRASLPEAINPWVAGARPPRNASDSSQLCAACAGGLSLRQLLIDLINRMPESLGRA